MELILERIAKRKAYTLPGTADDYFCDTLEPTWRDYANGAYKVIGRSAIPEGRILVGKNPAIEREKAEFTSASEREQGRPGVNREVGKVLDSRIWLHRLKQKIVEAKEKGEPVWITIK